MAEVKPEVKTMEPNELLRAVQHHADLAVRHARKAAHAAQELTRLNALKIIGILCRGCSKYPTVNNSPYCFGCQQYLDETHDARAEMKNNNNGDGL